MKVLEEEGRRKEAKAQLEMKGAELKRARDKLAAAQAEVALLKVKSSKY